jgi:ADP-heptose:LPS heptosyltransferase
MLKQRGNPSLHFFDRHLGIPAVAVLSRTRRKRASPAPSAIKTIGILKAGAIGDTVLISAVVADLRSAFPGASVIFFSGASNFEMASLLEGVDRVINVPVTNLFAGLKSIRSVAVDVLFDFGQWSRLEALFSFFSRAAFTIGFATPGQHRHFGHDIAVKHSCEVHELTNFRNLVNALGVPSHHPPFLKVPLPAHPGAFGYAVFHLWPGGRRRKLKEWPRERWRLLMQDFAGWGIQVVLTGSPFDRDRNDRLIASLASGATGFFRNAAGCSLKETAATLAGARLVVSVDTGLMHMAAALGVPLVALHGPTSSGRWGPVSPKAVIVESAMPGCGYISLGWENPPVPPACMDCISYETVRDACSALVQTQDGAQQNELPGVITRRLPRTRLLKSSATIN